MLRIASSCAEPAVRLPPVQARKGGGQMEKTHNTEGLGSENISMFFSNSIANKKGFLPRPARFRGWTGGAGREAGSWQGDAIRNVTGSAGIGGQTGIAYPLAMDGNTGALCPQGEKGTHSLSTMTSVNTYGGLVFDASHVVPTAAENRPVNIAVPVILYLGLSA